MIQSAIEVTNESEFIKALIVGDYGTGKSVFASTFCGKMKADDAGPADKPEVIESKGKGFVFDFDKGIRTYRGRNLDYAQYDVSGKGWNDFNKEFMEVEKLVKEGVYRTVVVDSTSMFADMAMESALLLDPKRSPTGGPLWNVHYGIVKNLVEGKLRRLLQWKCNILILAHQQVITDSESGAVIKIQPLLPGALSDKLPGYFDEVYISQSGMKDGKPDFTLQTLPRGLYKARSRISGQEQCLPMYIPNTYEGLMAAIAKGTKKK